MFNANFQEGKSKVFLPLSKAKLKKLVSFIAKIPYPLPGI